MLGGIQVAVVDLRLDAQEVAHQGVDVHCLEGPHHQVLVEGRSHCPEEGLHVHLLVVKAVLTPVDLNWEILQRRGDRHCVSVWVSLVVVIVLQPLSSRLLTCPHLVSRGRCWPTEGLVIQTDSFLFVTKENSNSNPNPL